MNKLTGEQRHQLIDVALVGARCSALCRQQVARGLKKQPQIVYWINGSIIPAAPSTPTSSLKRHAPVLPVSELLFW